VVLISSFGRMIFRITFCRNTISFSVNHNFSSAYSAISDTPGGRFWANKLLRMCRVIKVPIPTHLHFMLAKGLRTHSVYDYGGTYCLILRLHTSTEIFLYK